MENWGRYGGFPKGRFLVKSEKLSLFRYIGYPICLFDLALDIKKEIKKVGHIAPKWEKWGNILVKM